MMKKEITFLTLCLCLLFWKYSFTQSVVERPIVYQVEAMGTVEIEKNVVVKTADGNELNLDIYYPADFQKGQTLPAVIFANGGIKAIPDWKVYQEWAKLMAAHGMIAINHRSSWETRFQTIGWVLDYLHQNGAQHGVDGDHLSIWACSGNVTAAYPQVMDQHRDYLRAAVFYYGMPDQFAPPRQNLPLLLVRAGLDSYSLNTKIDQFLTEALLADTPIEFINYLEGYHAFDVLNDTQESRNTIKRTVAYLQEKLESPIEPKPFVLTTRNFYQMIQNGETEEALSAMRSLNKKWGEQGRPNKGYYRVAEEGSINTIGYQFMEEKRNQEAITVLQLNTEFFPESANAYDSLGDAYEANSQLKKALEMAKIALQKLEKNEKIKADQKEEFRQYLRTKIKRLE